MNINELFIKFEFPNFNLNTVNEIIEFRLRIMSKGNSDYR